jgi:hypothetical protein
MIRETGSLYRFGFSRGKRKKEIYGIREKGFFLSLASRESKSTWKMIVNFRKRKRFLHQTRKEMIVNR